MFNKFFVEKNNLRYSINTFKNRLKLKVITFQFNILIEKST